MWRPEGWSKQRSKWFDEHHNESGIKLKSYEAGADAILEALKGEGLHGEYLQDFLISVRVRRDEPDWAEPFLGRLGQMGYLIFIPDE